MQIRNDDPPLEIQETSGETSVIGMWGPHARHVLERVTHNDVSDEGFPFMQGRRIAIEGFDVWAQRVTYVRELGWELYAEPAPACQVWDRLMAAGRGFGIAPGGYRVLDSLRMEKGYRYYVPDMGLLANPFEAGVGFPVHPPHCPAPPPYPPSP